MCVCRGGGGGGGGEGKSVLVFGHKGINWSLVLGKIPWLRPP